MAHVAAAEDVVVMLAHDKAAYCIDIEHLDKPQPRASIFQYPVRLQPAQLILLGFNNKWPIVQKMDQWRFPFWLVRVAVYWDSTLKVKQRDLFWLVVESLILLVKGIWLSQRGHWQLLRAKKGLSLLLLLLLDALGLQKINVSILVLLVDVKYFIPVNLFQC